ncbi:hypothetical protein ACFL47_00400 [Candidatus Latescibacterota bacterium]
MDERVQFASLMGISFFATILGTYLTPPTDSTVLENFYRKTRPFGFWVPYKKLLVDGERTAMEHEHFYDIICIPVVLLWQITLLMLPMQVITKTWGAFGITATIQGFCLILMYFWWYKKLPEG